MVGSRYPAVVVHGLAHARVALAVGRPVTLLSSAGAALFAGCGWWRAVVEQARSERAGYSVDVPMGVPMDDILDCADAPGLALGALRIGQHRIVLSPTSPGWQSVATIAASLGGEVLTSRPPALDMADRGAARHLDDWLRARTTPGDSRNRVG